MGDIILVPSPSHPALLVALVEVDGLLILPGEDAAALIADREAVIQEKESMPLLGEPFDPSLDFDGILAEVWGQGLVRLSDEQLEEIEAERPGVELSTAPWLW